MYTSKYLDKCYHHHNQDLEHFHPPKKCLQPSFQSFPPPPTSNWYFDICYLSLVLSVLELSVNGTIQYVLCICPFLTRKWNLQGLAVRNRAMPRRYSVVTRGSPRPPARQGVPSQYAEPTWENLSLLPSSGQLICPFPFPESWSLRAYFLHNSLPLVLASW